MRYTEPMQLNCPPGVRFTDTPSTHRPGLTSGDAASGVVPDVLSLRIALFHRAAARWWYSLPGGRQ